MVTAERDVDGVRAALHGGAMQYLVKPFDYDDLAARLAGSARRCRRSTPARPTRTTIDRVFAVAIPAARMRRSRRG